MRITNYYIWSIVFSVFFLIVLTMLLIILDTEARMAYDEVTPFEFILLALATWRVTRLMITDKVTAWLREQFYDVKKTGRSLSLVQPDVGPRRVLIDLFSCPWCLGLSVAMGIGFLFFLYEWFFFVVLILALSAVAAATQVLLAHIVN